MVLLIDTHTECMHGINLYVVSSPSCSSGETTDVCNVTSPVMEGYLYCHYWPRGIPCTIVGINGRGFPFN